MRYMNDYDIDRARRCWGTHPILGPAITTLVNLVNWTNGHSDGWCSWQKPCRAAAKLMEMIERDGTIRYAGDEERTDVTEAEYRKALVPIKAFRTRQKANFVIVELHASEAEVVCSYCKSDRLKLAEDGYGRIWDTEISDNTVTASDGEFSDDGSGVFLYCTDCAMNTPLPEGMELVWL